ncbi:MAG: Glutathione S-transferase, N-terminal domain [Nevskia sp.]|nr:Glutathione S-transferase, N-terminal domain [Nevskia sp.]
MPTKVDALIYAFAGTVRGWRGSMVRGRSLEQPAQMLKLYDIESSPYCRLVREVLTEMDLDVLILPCPQGGTRFRMEALQVGGRQQFPLLVDGNTGATLYESADIVDYLVRTYRKRQPRLRSVAHQLTLASSYLASALMSRPGGIAGAKARSARVPEQPLELYSFEASPFSKPVRARLCELELPYILRNTGKGGWKDLGPPNFRDKLFKGAMGTTRNRKWLAEHTGRVQVPYLIDANTGVAMYESQQILQYLDKTYALG